MTNSVKNLSSFILFEVGWLLCVWHHSTVIGGVTLLFAMANLLLYPNPLVNFTICCLIATLGFCNDLLLVHYKIIHTDPAQALPIWLWCLWILFCSTFTNLLKFTAKLSLPINMLLGGVGGAISYFAGFKLSAIHYTFPLPHMIALHFINWVFLFPSLLWIQQRIQKLFSLYIRS